MYPSGILLPPVHIEATTKQCGGSPVETTRFSHEACQGLIGCNSFIYGIKIFFIMVLGTAM